MHAHVTSLYHTAQEVVPPHWRIRASHGEPKSAGGSRNSLNNSKSLTHQLRITVGSCFYPTLPTCALDAQQIPLRARHTLHAALERTTQQQNRLIRCWTTSLLCTRHVGTCLP